MNLIDVEFIMKLLVFVESGMTPMSFFWASVSVLILRHDLTPRFVWMFMMSVYLLNGILLELWPGKLCQPDTTKIKLANIFPIILTNLLSTFPLTFLSIRSDVNLTPNDVIKYLLIAGLGNELIYATIHRLFHTHLLYKYHSLHHAQKAPRALGATYCSLVEMWAANLSSFLLPLYLVDAPIQIYCIWIISGIQTTQLHHSGKIYSWSIGHQPQFHDDHHRFVKKNYGNLGFLEKILM